MYRLPVLLLPAAAAQFFMQTHLPSGPHTHCPAGSHLGASASPSSSLPKFCLGNSTPAADARPMSCPLGPQARPLLTAPQDSPLQFLYHSLSFGDREEVDRGTVGNGLRRLGEPAATRPEHWSESSGCWEPMIPTSRVLKKAFLHQLHQLQSRQTCLAVRSDVVTTRAAPPAGDATVACCVTLRQAQLWLCRLLQATSWMRKR